MQGYDVYDLLKAVRTEGELNKIRALVAMELKKAGKTSIKWRAIRNAYRDASHRLSSIPWSARPISWYDENLPDMKWESRRASRV